MYDIIIIGGGPAGLTAAIYAGRAGLKAVAAEKDSIGSGQIAVSERVDNYPGLFGIGGYELGERFRDHAGKFGTEFFEGEASEIKREGDCFTVSFKDGRALSGKTIIYAAGTSYRRLDVKGAQLLGVSYCAACDGAFYKDRTVAVIGGGDTALDDALYLAGIAKKVYLIHRREEFRGNMTLQKAVSGTPNIEIIRSAVLSEIIGENKVEAIDILRENKKVRLDADGVFAAIGSVPNTGLLEGIADLDENGYVIAGENGVTSAEGIFVAGDVRTKSLRQVITAAADGAMCVRSAEELLRKV